MLCSRCLRGLLANGKPSQWSLRPGPLTGAINLLHRRPNSTQSQQHTVENSSSTNNFSSGFVSDCTKPCLDGAVDIPAMSSRDDAEMPPKPLVPLPRPPSPTTTRFFRYTNYCTSSNKPVTVRFANTVGSANWLVSNMTGKVLGFDLEWMPNCPVNVSLVQICDEENILLLHLSQMKGVFPRALKTVLEDPNRIKCGVNIKSTTIASQLSVDDASRLATAHSVFSAGLLELGRLAQQLDPRWASIGVTRSIISLQQLVKMYLDKPLKKGLAFSTNWENRDLNPVERLYAANDCYAAWKVFQSLEAMRYTLPDAKLPDLIDYRHELDFKLKEQTRKNRTRLLNLLGATAGEGRRCVKLFQELDALITQKLYRL